MSDYGLQSVQYIRARVSNNFNIDFSDWKVRAIEWIGEFIGLLQLPIELQDHFEAVAYTDNQFKLPCDVKLLRGIKIGNYRIVINTTSVNHKWLVNESANLELSYSINPGGYVYVPDIESGTAYVHYKRVPLDDNGYPMVIDNEDVLEAATWFILLRMLGTGYIHPVFNNYDKLEYKVMGQTNPVSLFAKARNSVRDLTIDERLELSVALTGMIGNANYGRTESMRGVYGTSY